MRIDGVTADVSVWPTVEKCTERLGLLFTLESCLPHQTKEVQGLSKEVLCPSGFSFERTWLEVPTTVVLKILFSELLSLLVGCFRRRGMEDEMPELEIPLSC